MSTIFPLSASVGQEFQGYMYDGTIWNLIGNEYNPTTFSSTPPANPKPGDLWVDANSNVDILNEENLAYASDLNNYLTIESASSTYATKTELENIDLSPYLTQSSASATYATKSELENIDLSSASAAAVSYLVDSAPATLDTLNELAQALNDDANFAGTVTTTLSNKLNISDASATYLTQASASTQYEKLIPYSSSSIVNAQVGDLWIDSTASASPLLKTYNGTSWVQLGSSDDVFVRLNTQTILSNYTMPVGYNGVTAGPITIANGVTVTIPDGCSWSIV